jgi:uncharacterized protein DUF4145
VEQGLPTQIQQALDVIRVVGNNAVHPGELDPGDIAEMVSPLFELTNQIVEEMISKPKKLNALYGKIPKNARDAILRRDAAGEPASS